MDGYLKIKTKIDNKGIDKDIVELENKIKKLQEDNASSSKEQNRIQTEINNYEKLIKEADKYRQKLKEIEDDKKLYSNLLTGKNKIVADNTGTNWLVDVKTNANVQKVQDKLKILKLEENTIKSKIKEITSEFGNSSEKIDKLYLKLDKVKVKQTENNAKISQFKDKIEAIKIGKAQSQVENLGKGIQNQIGKIGKMAMAVIGLRTAWGAVRSAISMVSQYNDQVSTDFEYMRFCIANTLVPVIQQLVKLLYTVLSYVNAITTAWFGINLFSNSSAKAFQKMQKSAGGTAKSAKEIQKSLQGFDEMNIAQDNSSSGSGVSTPSMDLSGMQAEVPAWLQWIINNKDLIIGALLGIAGGLIAIKLGADLLNGLGIGLIFFGIYEIIQGLNKILNGDFIIGLTNYIAGLSAIALGVFILFGGIPALVTLVIGVIVLLATTLFKYGDEIKSKFDEFTEWLYNLIDKDWREMFGPFFGSILNETVAGIKDFIENSKKTLFGMIDFIQGIFTGDWNKAWNGLKTFMSGWIGQIFNIVTIPFRAIGGVINGVIESAKKAFSAFANFIKNFANNVGKSAGNIIGSAFKAVVNAVLSSVEKILNTPIRAINGLIGVINAVPGINLGYLNTFSLPRLAKGGVIAQPTQAIIGEAGKEAVVPLENNMEWLDILADKLASKIGTGGGSYIIQLDSRTIQRGIAKRQQELAFAKNGR